MTYKKKMGLHVIKMDVNEIGLDVQVSIYGGNIPHIGAVALAFPSYLAHDLKTMTTTVMNISVPGHKEDELTRAMAIYMAKELKKTVVINCGIHIDKITEEEIMQISKVAWSLVNTYIDSKRV